MEKAPSFFDTSINFLKGVGPQRSEFLKKELNIHTFRDLFYFFPFRYVDRTRFYKIKEVNADMPHIQLLGKIIKVEIVGAKRRQRMVVDLEDDTGRIELVWFQSIKWMSKKLRPGVEYIVFGKPSIFNGKFSISHPAMEEKTEESIRMMKGLQPVYSTTELLKGGGLDSAGILKLQRVLVPMAIEHINEDLPQYLIDKLRLMPRKEAMRNIHLPVNNETLIKAQQRLKFEELFYLQMSLLRSKIGRETTIKGFVFSKVDRYFNEFYNSCLPFPLTDAQKRVVKEIRQDMGRGIQMNRLLQGDVGSGKTLVALLCMLIALDNGFQCCLMAPTEILATQHFETLKEFLKDLPVTISLITGSTKESKRKGIHAELEEGQMQIIVGTHALIEDRVKFKNLGLVVIDEQHRFGVAQRARLWAKSEIPPHVLVMTATPIPRTLAMTLYGDLDVSVIDQLPPGRIPIETVHKYDAKRSEVYAFIKKEIDKGRQAYVIYPLIDESEKVDIENLMSGFAEMQKAFPGHVVAMMHGKMKIADKERVMQGFANGEVHILVATTVIEVGVNVPNASIILIESSQRFGLSQLHQLRGRVGRSVHKSYCILMTPYELGADARARIDIMVRSTDGFEISEEDLKLRGPGDITGTQQSGVLDLKIAELAKDGQILQQARIIATEILSEDRELVLEKNRILAEELRKLDKEKGDWSRIS
ncbi:MAG TPA: ATP-dependent DNA helicase RecG [Bacteroidia bacterium]|jgi:ATP-dependent DNA helicase RecG|nr:ATP-dependent DNA helicase RecG [Bacteroidia bacterium]